ncbi:MAG: NAD(P)/FAD-dependent oxidoreductase [Anaerolineae bacterium]|nr:NAD(P)/FAD-dependent oxidoreductase [Anaerolineae bacterium]
MKTTVERARIAVIGGGVAGLTAAYELASRGYAVAVYEGDGILGGLAAGFRADNWEWPLDCFYHHVFQSDRDVIDLARELGVPVFFRRPITAIYHQGKPYPFDSPLRLLLFPHLSLLEKLRMGLVIAYLRWVSRDWRRFERHVAHEWLRRWMGERAYQALWEPLLAGKFGNDYQTVNLAWFWARIYKRSPALGYFEGGFQALVDRLAEAAQRRGAHIWTSTRVEQIQPQDHQLTVTTNRGEESFDAVISTVAPQTMARIAPALPEAYRSKLLGLRSIGALAMTVALDRPLTDGLYWVNLPKKEGFPFLALVEHTNYIEAERYGGQHLVYLGDYLAPTHPHFQMSSEELADRFLPALARFNPDFQRSWVQGIWLHRAAYAQPVVSVDYSQQIPSLATPLPGLYFASMSQVYPWDRGTNYAVRLGRTIARMTDEDLSAGRVQSEAAWRAAPRPPVGMEP